VPLRPASFYSDNGIELRLKTSVSSIDIHSRSIIASVPDSLARVSISAAFSASLRKRESRRSGCQSSPPSGLPLRAASSFLPHLPHRSFP
jgi:hypothetical protein